MILKTFFLINIAQLESKFEIDLSNNEYVCFCVDSDDEISLESFLNLLFISNIKSPFIICIEEKKAFSPDLIKRLCRFILPMTFHYRYFKSEYNKPLFFINTTQSDFFSNSALFKDEYIRQGFKSPDCIHLNTQTEPDFPAEDQEKFYKDLQKKYQHAFESFSPQNNALYISITSLNDLSQSAIYLREHEKEIFREKKNIFSLMKRLSDLEKQKLSLSLYTGNIEQRLLSVQSYQSADNPVESEHRRKMNELIRFYDNEYEILPLWYKRLGHVIKVLMGKRTFRSLYDNNAKKYKM
jgi:hypothetical protein